MSKYIAVIGGANLDVCGYPYAPLIMNDSNPASVRTSAGGVGRNIAHNLALLGADVSMITAIGDDHAGHVLQSACADAGIDMSRALVCDSPTSTYICINDENGDMALGCSDMSILKRMDKDFFEERLDFINSAAACVIDTNLPEAMIKWLSERISAPIFAETVSVNKCERLRGALGNIFALKANLIEAQRLSKKDTPESCAGELLAAGVDLVYITLGAKGVYIANRAGSVKADSVVENIVNTTGAGDAFLAAAIWAHLKGLSLENAAKLGMKASAICVSCDETVAKDIAELRPFFKQPA